MRKILLAVSGLSPQVITETLFALHHNNHKIDEIHVITTREGKERIHAELLAGGTGQYFRYLSEYGIDPESIRFDASTIHTITDEHGREIPDIIEEVDSEHLLKECLELAFRFTKDPDTAVFFSVAGGRKTMSACLTLAAQIYGRPQDRLYHVLVTPEFEKNRDFFYPPKKSKIIELRDESGRPFFKETRYASVNLIHIPFISIRDKLSPDLLDTPRDPGTLLLSLIKEDEKKLTVDLRKGKIIYKTLELDMMPSWLALYAFFAERKKNCEVNSITCGDCTQCFMDIQSIYKAQSRITEIYRGISKNRVICEMSDTGITNLSVENFNMYKGKIRKALLTRFGPYALKELEIASVGHRPGVRYGILMDKSRISVVYPGNIAEDSI